MRKGRTKNTSEVDVKTPEAQKESVSDMSPELKEVRHHVFENDDFQKPFMESVSFTKPYPRRRGGRNADLINVAEPLNLDQIKNTLRKTERLYS